jgi:hypothetical protein
MNIDFQIIQPGEIEAPNLNILQFQALLTTVNAVGAGLGQATVAVTYPKQTDEKPRIAGEHYVGIPGIAPDVLLGSLSVHRRVDNPANRRAGVVGKVYLKVASVTRGNGVKPVGFANVRPEGLRSFVVTGFQPTVPMQTAQAPGEGA